MDGYRFIADNEQFLLNLRLAAVQECIKRTRLAFLVAFFAAVVTLVGLWNAEYSVDKLTYFDPGPFAECGPASGNQATFVHCAEISGGPHATEHLRDSLIDHWADGIYISVPVLGIHVSVRDFALYNSFAMVFLTLYFLLSERRENREVGSLLRDIHAGMYLKGVAEQHARHMTKITVYRAICAFFIFNVPTNNDRPLQYLTEAEEEKEARGKKYGEIPLLRPAITVTAWFPVGSILVNLLYEQFHTGLGRHYPQLAPYLGRYLAAQSLPRPTIVIEFLCLLLTSYWTIKIGQFHGATQKIAGRFKATIIEHEAQTTTRKRSNGSRPNASRSSVRPRR